MDNRRLVIGMLVAMALMLLWPQIVVFIGTKLGYDMTRHPTTAPSVASTQQSGNPVTDSTALAEGNPTSATSPAQAASGGLRAVPAATQPSALQLGSAVRNDPNYRMAVTVFPQGGGLDSVILNQFKKAAQGSEPYTFQQPYDDAKGLSRSLATRSVTIDGSAVDLSNVEWTLDESTQQSAAFSVTIEGSSGPVARVRKTYRLMPESDPSQGYEVQVTQSVENLTDGQIKFRTTLNGPTMPPRESDRGGDRQVLAGYDQKNMIQVTHDAIESFGEKQPVKDYTKDKEGNPIVWAGPASIYFNALLHPLPLDSGKGIAGYISEVSAACLNPSATADNHEVAMAFSTTELSVQPHQSLAMPFRVYFGPRERKVLNGDYYSRFPLSYNETLVLTSGPCAVCTFQWLIDILVWLLNAFHMILRDWGLSIITLVILVRAILHPVTKRSQISMSKMSKMGPEMERLKKKHGDNKEELNKAMMGFYKEQGVTPVLGCLPMFLQMPIWIALWQSLQTTFELRQAPFLWGFTWIHDLSKPDHLLTWPAIPLIMGFQLSALNILPILMGLVMWVQAKMQPKPAAMTPEQAQQQKMMQWMTLLFPLMLYNGPSGLNLYILTSTGIGIIESKIIRDHIKQREEAEKAQRVIVDPGKKFKSGGGGSLMKKIGERAKAGGLMGWIASIQDRAEQVRRDTDKRK